MSLSRANKTFLTLGILIIISLISFAYISSAKSKQAKISKNKAKISLSTSKPLYNLVNVLPGATNVSCVTITYSGKTSGQVKAFLNKNLSQTGAKFINLTINQGQYSIKKKNKSKNKILIPKNTSCKNYKKKRTIYNGTLSNFSTKYSSLKKGLKLKNIKKKTKWKNKDKVSYQFIVSVQGGAPAGITTSDHKFVWQTK